jgi:hypothetical protein
LGLHVRDLIQISYRRTALRSLLKAEGGSYRRRVIPRSVLAQLLSAIRLPASLVQKKLRVGLVNVVAAQFVIHFVSHATL